MSSIEEKVEEYYKSLLDNVGLRHYSKTEGVNTSIDNALKEACSKSGGNGNNYPDIKCLLDDSHGRTIPVMIEAKGSKGKLEKLNKDGTIVGITTTKNNQPNYSAIQNYAVNGALHYGQAILDGEYSEVIIIGVNGSELDPNGNVIHPEYKAYYISENNHRIPKLINELDAAWGLFRPASIGNLLEILDDLNLTDDERERLIRRREATLEDRIKNIHQSIYDNGRLKSLLNTNEKLYLFCGLIMAGLTIDGVAPLTFESFSSNDNKVSNDGTIIIRQITTFLNSKNCSPDKVEMVINLLSPVFTKNGLWKPKNGESIIKILFNQVKNEIIPCLESDLHLDFSGKILNRISDWVHIENDAKNDVVLTPRYITTFMARLARTNMNSFVWDRALGSAGFLVSAMDLMIKDAKNRIHDPEKLAEKIRSIKNSQLLGIEILGNIYILAVLNMILMGDGSSNIIYGDSHEYDGDFNANVFLLNPPYSAEGKGFVFVEEALNTMNTGYACVLIKESAASGQGLPYTKRILERNTLLASIHMPPDIFRGKSSVQTSIFLFQVARPHEREDNVTFIDMSNDGYTRKYRRTSNSSVNLVDTDHAVDRYAEVVAILLNQERHTSYYTVENGRVIVDTIQLTGDDWTFNQHKKLKTTPTEQDFKNTVADYITWEVSSALKG